MVIALAQIRPVRGNTGLNITHHQEFIALAAVQGAEAIVFPELSLTGYEPSLAAKLATTVSDPRFNVFDELSNRHALHIMAGMPLRAGQGVQISLIIFSPGGQREVYSKQYLHKDELPFFVTGETRLLSLEEEHNLSLAICYELSVPMHAEAAFRRGSRTYVASVAKSHTGVETAAAQLSAIARQYSMMTLMSNCVGHCDDFECGGGTAAWNRQGDLIGKLGKDEEGLLVFDTEKELCIPLPGLEQKNI